MKKPDESLDDVKLQLISNGSLIGIGLGIFLTSLFTAAGTISFWVGVTILGFGIYTMNQNWWMVKK